MKLHYCQIGNFGDELNPWLWQQLIPELLDDDESTLFLAIGTIIDKKKPQTANKIVFGAGTGYKAAPHLDDKWKIYGVRGPLTAKILNLPPELVMGDSAYLVRHCFHTTNKTNKTNKTHTINKIHTTPSNEAKSNETKRISLMPHIDSLGAFDWPTLAEYADMDFIDPREPIDTVLKKIEASKLIITEAMHGAIVADALRTPWLPLRFSQKFLTMKWHDWLATIDLPFESIDLPSLYEGKLSAPKILMNQTKRTLAKMNLGKEKWSRRPVKTCTQHEIEEAAQFLRSRAAMQSGFLSEDKCLDKIVTKQLRLLEQLKNE